jgi:glutathione synthase/RimK-type ligase-like ATP-grasp enzyme
MANQIIVVENLKDWKADFPEATVVKADNYLASPEYFKMRHVQVVNLCRGYRYQSVGYYCGLLAQARSHRTIPSVKTMLNLSSKAMYGLDVEDLDGLVERAFRRSDQRGQDDRFVLEIFFGECGFRKLADLARQIYETFPCPLLQVTFRYGTEWRIQGIKPLSLHKLDEAQRELFVWSLQRYFKKRWRSPKNRALSRYDLAVLHNPDDPLPPSDKRALQQLVKAGKGQGVAVDLIRRKDYPRLAEYDALFIRDTTRINHYTYRFAKRAEGEGMVVIDDPTSILRCTNKVYLAELLRANRIPAPKGRILHKSDRKRVALLLEREFDYPIVLKVPDGSFSLGVYKAENRTELQEIAERLFRESELILAQEYLYTEFDWRVGILNRTPIFVCQYFMSKKHWQIVNHRPGGRFDEGGFRTWQVGDAPAEVVTAALSAANLIGDSFYGVDVKQNDAGVYVIEVNDNPNLEAGVEDAYLGQELYNLVIRDFVRRLDERRYR